MADIFCPRCGEPWDVDSLAEEAAARKEEGAPRATYDEVIVDFRTKGCGETMTAYGFGRPCQETPLNPIANASKALFELLGNDVDGVANETEDLIAMGAI